MATANKAANTIICNDTINIALENYFTLSTFCNLQLAFFGFFFFRARRFNFFHICLRKRIEKISSTKYSYQFEHFEAIDFRFSSEIV